MFKYSPLPRHPKSVEGDFYAEDGQCLACGVPHLVAPALLAWVDEERSHCFWKKQPQTPQGLEQAIQVLEVQELGCHRYNRQNSAILKRVRSTYGDHPVELEFSRPLPLEPTSPHFNLLNDRKSVIARIWERIVGHQRYERDFSVAEETQLILTRLYSGSDISRSD